MFALGAGPNHTAVEGSQVKKRIAKSRAKPRKSATPAPKSFRVRHLAVKLYSRDEKTGCPITPVTFRCPPNSECGKNGQSRMNAVFNVPPLAPQDLPAILRELETATPLKNVVVRVVARQAAFAAAKAVLEEYQDSAARAGRVAPDA
jgi:hypothetical protein